MEKTKWYLNYIALAIAAVLVGLDQYFKHLAVVYLYPIETHPVWDGVFQLTYVENRGAAFGIFAGKKIWLIGVTGLILLLLIAALVFRKIKQPALIWSVSLLIGGGIGNLIDRALYGYVVDYLHVTLFDFPVFNFADCCVVVGIIMAFIYILFFDKSQNKPEKDDTSEDLVK